MPDLEFQPELIGRESELEVLEGHLVRASEGNGTTVFISGEAGIGKTRLMNELRHIAETKGFRVLSGHSLYESMTPYMPFREALRSGGLEYLLADESPRVEAVYLVTDVGLLVKEVVRKGTHLDADIFSSTLATVADFVKESLSVFRGDEARDSLNRIGYGDYVILIENEGAKNLVVILTGRENEFLIDDMREVLKDVESRFGDVLKDWDGDEGRVESIEDLLKTLIMSGKYDGTYYGEANPEARRNLLMENVTLGLSRLSQTEPTLLCIDDLQWADPSTLAMMHYLSRNTTTSGVFILGAYRPEDLVTNGGKGHPLNDRIRLMNREGLHEVMDLGRLPVETISSFLPSLLGDVDFDEEFEQRIHKETEGNPLFIIELARLMVEEDIITKDNGTWKLGKSMDEVSVPSKIHDVIARKLDRLGAEERRILDYASVIGEVFRSEILAASLEVERIGLLEILRDLEQSHKLIHSQNGGYKFDHSKIKEVLYSKIPSELRREYHSVVADSIESLNRDSLDEVVEDLAFHYYRGRNKEEALRYLIKAADKCKKDYSNEEAIRFYSDALDLESDVFRRMELLEGRGEVYRLIGDLENAKRSFEQALELAEDDRSRARIMVKIADIHLAKREYEESVNICKRALKKVEGTLDEVEGNALHTLGNISATKGDYDKGREYYGRSVEIREKIGDKKGMAGSLSNMGIIYADRGEYEAALEHYNRSLEISEEIGDKPFASNHLNGIGLVYKAIGDYDRALESLKKSLEINKTIGHQYGTASAYNNIGLACYEMGNYDEALDFFDKALSVKRKIGDRVGIATTLDNQSLIFFYKGDYERALNLREKALAILEEMGSPKDVAITLGNIGHVYYCREEYDRALHYSKKSLKLREELDDRFGMSETYCDLADIYYRKGDLRTAMDYCNQSSEIAEETGVKFNIGRSLMVFGMIEGKKEDWEEAINHFHKGIGVFKEIGTQKELGLCYFEFGLMWKARGDFGRAKEYLEKANVVFEKLKWEIQLDMVRDALSDLESN